MVTVFQGNGLWLLVKQSDTMSIIILLVLLFISLICWATFFLKFFSYALRKQQVKKTIRVVQQMHSADEFSALAAREADTFSGSYIAKVVALVRSITGSHTLKVAHIPERSWDLIGNQIGAYAEQYAAQEDDYNVILLTGATVSPLLGLLGTVWGLVHAFMNIAQQQSADIAAVAPGIAEALITTIAGLFVAIPALIMYNIAQRWVRDMEDRMYQLADSVTLVLDRTHN